MNLKGVHVSLADLCWYTVEGIKNVLRADGNSVIWVLRTVPESSRKLFFNFFLKFYCHIFLTLVYTSVKQMIFRW